MSGNNALLLNPVVADIDITVRGSDFLWAVFSLMGASFIGVSLFTFFKIDRGQRTFHYLIAALLGTASIAYFSLAADLGSTPVTVEFLHGNWARTGSGINGLPTRSIWYVRYIDWVVTTPLLLLTLLLSSPIPLSTVFMTIFMDLVMIITGLIGALVPSNYKWGYFAFGCAALGWVYYILFGPALSAAKRAGDDVRQAYFSGAAMLSFLWAIYPIIWGLSEGGNVIHPDSEVIAYSILDLLAKPVFSAFHLWSLSKIDYERFGLTGGKGSVFLHQGEDHISGTGVGNRIGSRSQPKTVNAAGRQSDVTAADTHA